MNSIYYGEILEGGGALGSAAGLVRGFVGRVGWAGERLGWAGRLGWVGLVRGFVGSWVALGFVWVSFPRATSEGFSFSKLIAGVETRVPRTYPRRQPDRQPRNKYHIPR